MYRYSLCIGIVYIYIDKDGFPHERRRLNKTGPLQVKALVYNEIWETPL